MNDVHNRCLDLNLLIVAEAIYRHLNLTATAKELGLTPSAVSHALGRLTRYYGAPLFVRAAHGVVTTELGRRLEPEISSFRTAAKRVLERDTPFDAAKAEGRIYIAATEYFELVIGHPLIAVLQKQAPRLQLCFLDVQSQLLHRALEAGQIDLAVAGFFRDLPEGLAQRRLYQDEFATLAGGQMPGHRPLTLQEYTEAAHLLITLTGDFEGKVDVALRKLGLSRRIVAATASFATPAWLLQKQNLVLTAPRLLLTSYQEFVGRPPQACPIALGNLDLQMVWHKRTQKDPLRHFVRERIVALCRKLQEPK